MRISDWSSDVCSSDLLACQDVLYVAVRIRGQSQNAVQDNNDFVPGLAWLMNGVRINFDNIDNELATMRHQVFGARFEVFHPVEQVGNFTFDVGVQARSEEHTSELQSLMRISYAVFCL